MERNISETEAKKLKKYRLVFGILIVLLIGLAIPLYLRLGRYACIPFGILFIATMLCGLRIEEKEKENEIEKYKEIICPAIARTQIKASEKDEANKKCVSR